MKPRAEVTADSPRVALTHPDFRAWLASRALATVAHQIQTIGVGWAIYQATHRPLDLGLVGLAIFLPTAALSLLAGHAADRLVRRSILLVSHAALLAGAVALLALQPGGAGGRSIAPVYAVLVGVGAARAFLAPASQALVTDLVPLEHFANAVSWSSGVWQLASVAGPVAGGLLCQTAWGASAAFLAAAALHTGSVLLLLRIRPRPAHRGEPLSPTTLLAGVRYVWTRRLILGAISLDLFAVLLGGSVALLPVYAEDILRVGPWGYGLLRSAPGLGAIAMALVLARWPLRRHAGATMLGCVALFGVATIVFGLSRSFGLSLGALVVLGAADMVSIFVRKTLVQLATPAEMRGRVSAVGLVFIGASNELGELESGLTAQLLGTTWAVVLGGVGTLAVVALWAALFPQLRRVQRTDDVRPDDDAFRSPRPSR